MNIKLDRNFKKRNNHWLEVTRKSPAKDREFEFITLDILTSIAMNFISLISALIILFPDF